ncbi:OmpA family protein [Streptomyces xanthochromogenes]|uniref:OmpA family protein n=1 Tax=Streptomyces xanthochromogenes TaxID=67384 RepID=UPI00341D0027
MIGAVLPPADGESKYMPSMDQARCRRSSRTNGTVTQRHATIHKGAQRAARKEGMQMPDETPPNTVVYFEPTSSVVSSASYADIANSTGFMNAFPQRYAIIEGHTDSVGTDEENQRLSQRRADAVKACMVKGGIASNRLQAVGYGEAKPAGSNPAKNRRVEIVF